MHEDFSRVEKVTGSSERSFGRVMAGFFVLVFALPLLHAPRSVRWWALGVAIVFAVLAQWWPAPLAPLNRLWLRFGLLLHRIVSPIVLGLLFYLTVLPVSLIMRALGKDLLRLRARADATSYWIPREPPGPTPESMKHQF